jgi:hypothetical protein
MKIRVRDTNIIKNDKSKKRTKIRNTKRRKNIYKYLLLIMTLVNIYFVLNHYGLIEPSIQYLNQNPHIKSIILFLKQHNMLK